MKKVDTASWAKIQNGTLLIANKALRLPNLQLGEEIGRGANAVVFSAVDTTLNRPVAVKIWNSRGQQRAQAETAKIAKLKYPLIVTTHLLQWVDEYPYAVMELVDGHSCKKWLATNPPIQDRLRVWELYSRALRYMHEHGAVHGDPHTGNILVYPDLAGHFHDGASKDAVPIGIKVADAGTSEFLSSRSTLLEREADLIFETATRLLQDQNVGNLWSHPHGLNHIQTLKVLDALVEFIRFTIDYQLSDQVAANAQILVRFVLNTPLFRLDGVLASIKNGSQTTTARFARRLNRDLFELHDLFDAVDEVDEKTLGKYEEKCAMYLRNLKSSCDA